MMCSNWKISVFGIVALMLAFGLTSAMAPSPDAYSDALQLTLVAPRGTGCDHW